MAKSSPESEARRALARLRRAVEKAARELETLKRALEVSGGGLPGESYQTAEEALSGVVEFALEEERRLRAKILQAGGLDPARVRRKWGSS